VGTKTLTGKEDVGIARVHETAVKQYGDQNYELKVNKCEMTRWRAD
jgi:hypothetical protein